MKKITLFLLTLGLSILTNAQTAAFPGAGGGGMYATGGRGGKVLVVNSLADDGSVGTFRWAVGQSGPRIIVFRVGGTITLKSRISISKDDITIAGQTAPGYGICLKDYDLSVSANNVIIRYIRVRLGNMIIANESDAAGGRYRKNIILDHCSFSWSIDECASFYSNENFTMQWCYITESLNNAGHSKGAHGYGGIWGGKNASFHHNLIAHHNSRNPRFNGYKRSGLSYTNPLDDEIVDFRNNVIYNWGDNSSYGGESGHYNIVGNYFKFGPGTKSTIRYKITQVDIDADPSKYPPGFGTYYIQDNFTYGNSSVSQNNWTGVTYASGVNKTTCKTDVPYTCTPIAMHTAETAFERVLSYGGCSLQRDTVDKRIAYEAKTGTATYKGSITLRSGIIDTQNDVGGWPELTYDPTSVPTDTDNDGMPDEWENTHGLNPTLGTDAITKTIDSEYSNIEVYANELVSSITNAENEGIISAVSTPIVEKLNFYPNPVKDGKLYIPQNNSFNSIRIYTLSGICVLEQKYLPTLNSLDISMLPKGIYIIDTVINNYKHKNMKLIIQ